MKARKVPAQRDHPTPSPRFNETGPMKARKGGASCMSRTWVTRFNETGPMKARKGIFGLRQEAAAIGLQ